MSEETPKFFKMMKTTPADVFMVLHQFSNPQITKVIHLTQRNPFQMLPLDWALGIFTNDGNYALYKKGVISFENNDALVKAAYDAGAYFSEELDFKPVDKDFSNDIFEILKTGDRSKITTAISDYGRIMVKNVAVSRAGDLTAGVLAMLENMLKVQLLVEGGTFDNN